MNHGTGEGDEEEPSSPEEGTRRHASMREIGDIENVE